jgi:hypothetical protein
MTKTHLTKFIFHPKVVIGLSDQQIEERARGFIGHLNFLLKKNTIRELIYNGYIITEDRPYSNSYFDLPIDNWEFWIHANFSDKGYSYAGSTGVDESGASVSYSRFWKLYHPSEINNEDYINQIGTVIHEFGHLFLMPGELYYITVSNDFDKSLPNLSIDIRGITPKDEKWKTIPLWKNHIDWYYDPMCNFISLEESQFSQVNAAAINGPYHSPKYTPKLPDITNIYIQTDPGAYVRVIRNDQENFTSSVISEGLSDDLGLFHFNWTVNSDDLLSNESDRLRFIKISKNGFEPVGTVIDVMELFETVLLKNSNVHICECYLSNQVQPESPPPPPPPIVNPPPPKPQEPPVSPSGQNILDYDWYGRRVTDVNKQLIQITNSMPDSMIKELIKTQITYLREIALDLYNREHK